jgi:hypothetical protein
MKKIFIILALTLVISIFSTSSSFATDICSTEPLSSADFNVEITSAVYLRDLSCMDSNIIATLSKGEVVHVIGKTEGWHKIERSDGTQGWIWETFVTSTDKPFNSSNDSSDLNSGDEASDPMYDIEGHKYEEAIWYVYDNGIVSGYPDGSFKPDKEINRAELLKIIVESGYNDDIIKNYEGKSCFTDIDSNEWYAKYVCLGLDKGIVQGYPDGSFKPANQINFVEALKIAMVGLGYGYEEGDPWYANILDTATLNDKNFVPNDIENVDDILTRAQMAEMITRMIKYNNAPSELQSYLGDDLYVKIPTFDATTNALFLNALENHNADTISSLIDDGFNVNVYFDDDPNDGIFFKNTPLHIAAANGDQDIVELLIDAGADLNAVSSAGFQDHVVPLYEAAFNGHKDIVELLLDKGADINGQGTALHAAVNQNHKDIVELLIQRGADVNSLQTYSGLTPLDLAMDEDIENLLLDAGAKHADEL